MCCIILTVGLNILLVYLQVEGNGNCMFAAIKKVLRVRHAEQWDHLYYPMRYFRCQVVMWLSPELAAWVWFNKHVALEVNYRQEEQTATYKGPLTYKSYCCHLLQWSFWGDEVVLYTVSGMWGMHITVLNSKTDQEYHICHNAIMDMADMNLIYNAGMHYTAAGGSPVHFTGLPV